MKTLTTTTRVLVALLLLIGYCSLQGAIALKCLNQDNGSEAEFKRITRICMRKISESSYGSAASQNRYQINHNNNHNTNTNNNNHKGNNNRYSDEGQQRYGNQREHDDADSDELMYYHRHDNIYNANNNQQNYGNYNHKYDLMTQRNRQRQQMHERPGISDLRSSNVNNSANHNERAGSGGRTKTNGNNNNNNGNSNNSNNRGGAGAGGGGGSAHQATLYNRNSNTSGIQENCVAHCFFAELNTLNSDDYPDRQKVKYIVTKDLRDRELRTFYNDTITECFHYMESQRRRDGSGTKCSYANELIRCMTEYAKANCDDWQEHSTIVFN